MPKSSQQIQAELEKIEAMLSSGVKSVTVDGTTTQIDLAALQKRASQLRSLLTSEKARRPRSASIYLGGM